MAESKRGLLGRLFGNEAPAEPAPPTRSEPALARGEQQDEPRGTASSESAAPTEEAATTGWWGRLKSGLSRSTQSLTSGISDLFTKKKLDAESLEELEELLLKADLGSATAAHIVDALSRQRLGKEISPDEVREVLAAEVEKALVPVARPLVIDPSKRPFVILMVGVNGTGKTTTIGKLAARFRSEGRSVTLAAGDTFRAAAIEQLKIWGERSGAPVIAHDAGSDAAGLAYDAFQAAQESGSEVLMIDTAGRLHNKTELMAELAKIVRVLKKLDASAPHAVLLTLDATTGQNALNQVDVFREQAGVTGLVMTKLDGTARGGILVALAEKFGLPVHFIGVGETADDLQPFSAREFAQAIAGIN